jgi:hypothetical protein
MASSLVVLQHLTFFYSTTLAINNAASQTAKELMLTICRGPFIATLNMTGVCSVIYYAMKINPWRRNTPGTQVK